jgi:hypothetical protein
VARAAGRMRVNADGFKWRSSAGMLRQLSSGDAEARANRGLLPLSGSEAKETGSCPRFGQDGAMQRVGSFYVWYRVPVTPSARRAGPLVP